MENQAISRLLERGLYGGIVGLMYAMSNLKWEWEMMLATTTIGFSIGFFTGLLDRWLFNTRLRRQKFIVVLLVRSSAYLIVIMLSLVMVAGIYQAISTRTSIVELIESEILVGWITEGDFAYIVLYSLVVLLVLQFVTLVSRLLGPNVLLNYMLGRYHAPKEEERIFMFVDLRSSTTIAEQLGPMNWHKFLNDFFFDLAKPIRRYRGEIYQYVGDEVVISWPKDVGVKNLNCIKCFFSILTRIDGKKEKYLKIYGYEPVFKAGYHVGKVIVGEIGDYKRDIVFHGDTVNTASRIQVECNNYDRRLLLSNTLLDLLDLKGQFTSEYITKIRLRGKEEVLELYSLDPVEKMDRVI
jgi:adenylate cyclase